MKPIHYRQQFMRRANYFELKESGSIPIKRIKSILRKYISEDIIIINRDKRIIIMAFDLKDTNDILSYKKIGEKMGGLSVYRVRTIINKFCNDSAEDIRNKLESSNIEIESSLNPMKGSLKKRGKGPINDNTNLGLSVSAYSFLMTALIWRNTETELLRSIKSYLENNDSDTFEELIKFAQLPNITLTIAQEIDKWYIEATR